VWEIRRIEQLKRCGNAKEKKVLPWKKNQFWVRWEDRAKAKKRILWV